MFRRIAAPVVALVLGLALGLGADALADRDAPSATAAAVNRNPDVVRELRALKRDLVREVGYVRSEVRRVESTVDALRSDTARKLDILNRSVGGYTTISGSTSLAALLQDIDRNTR